MALHRNFAIEQIQNSCLFVYKFIPLYCVGVYWLLCDPIAIPNLYAVQTITSTKAATALNKAIPEERTSPLNILLQVNTSGEDSKSGLPPLTSSSVSDSELGQLARHIVKSCPRLHLQGLMTIGSLAQSLSNSENEDFEKLRTTRDVLQNLLNNDREDAEDSGQWGENGKLLLSMGMSSDFEAALKAGSDIVRVGTGIFGERYKRSDVN